MSHKAESFAQRECDVVTARPIAQKTLRAFASVHRTPTRLGSVLLRRTQLQLTWPIWKYFKRPFDGLHQRSVANYFSQYCEIELKLGTSKILCRVTLPASLLRLNSVLLRWAQFYQSLSILLETTFPWEMASSIHKKTVKSYVNVMIECNLSKSSYY